MDSSASLQGSSTAPVAENSSAFPSHLPPPQLSETDQAEGAGQLRPSSTGLLENAGLNEHQAQTPSFDQNITSAESDLATNSSLLDMHLRALRAKEKAWGASHPTTLNTVVALGRLYASQGHLVEADEMYRRAIEGYGTTNGADHPTTLEIAMARESLRGRSL